MPFDEVLAGVLDLLQRQGQVSYRVLKRRFDLDDDYLEDLSATSRLSLKGAANVQELSALLAPVRHTTPDAPPRVLDRSPPTERGLVPRDAGALAPSLARCAYSPQSAGQTLPVTSGFSAEWPGHPGSQEHAPHTD
jgi:hypothetical protein